jgi:integration host factor subunit alpha
MEHSAWRRPELNSIEASIRSRELSSSDVFEFLSKNPPSVENSKSRPGSVRRVTRSALAAAVYDCGRVSREEARRFVEVMLSEIAHALSRGESVKLVSFGSFVVRSKGERVGRNPRTGVEATISARRVVVFRPAKELSARVDPGRRAEDD